MARERDRGESFDPRTWGGGARPAPVAASAPAKPAAAAERRTVPSHATPMASPAAPRRPLLIALGISALLLVGGAVIARLHPSAPPLPRPAATPGPADPPAAASVDPEQRVVTVAGPGDIAKTLAGAGIATEVADGAGREAATVLGDRPGPIRLTIDLPSAGELGRLEARRGDGSGVMLAARPDGTYLSEPFSVRRR